jgi:hypothetical protein
MMGSENSLTIGAGLQIKINKGLQETVPTTKYM